MAQRAKLQVTTGPDRGKSFELTDELVHIGKGTGNQIVLSDPTLPEHTASIVTRNGRYAIYTTAKEGIEVEGNAVPPERWVWLPTEANIRISQRTMCQFVSPEADVSLDQSQETSVETEARPRRIPNGEPPPERPKKSVDSSGSESADTEQRPEKPKKSRKNVAKFITDGPGDPLVKLGADGHLPELRLTAGQARGEREEGKGQSSPMLLYAAIAGSFLLTILLLFVDTETRSEGGNKAEARAEIANYYGEPDEQLAPYQMALRRAAQARSRRDFETEQAEYRNVLNLLRAEGRGKSLSGLTGNKRGRSDEKLEEYLVILLGD